METLQARWKSTKDYTPIMIACSRGGLIDLYLIGKQVNHSVYMLGLRMLLFRMGVRGASSILSKIILQASSIRWSNKMVT